jgi:tetratricopeptide (TPR) repeat protein
MLILLLTACNGDKMVEDGVILYAEGNYEEARDILLKAREGKLKEYSTFQIDKYLSLIFIKLGDGGNAVKYAKNVVDADTYSVDSWTNYGLALKTDGQQQAAADAYENALALGQKLNPVPDLSKTYTSLGALYFEMGEPVKARDSLLHSIESNPDFADAYAYIAIVYASLYQFEESDAMLQQAIALGYTKVDEVEEQIAHYTE